MKCHKYVHVRSDVRCTLVHQMACAISGIFTGLVPEICWHGSSNVTFWFGLHSWHTLKHTSTHKNMNIHADSYAVFFLCACIRWASSYDNTLQWAHTKHINQCAHNRTTVLCSPWARSFLWQILKTKGHSVHASAILDQSALWPSWSNDRETTVVQAS